jgi:hypothetical protein
MSPALKNYVNRYFYYTIRTATPLDVSSDMIEMSISGIWTGSVSSGHGLNRNEPLRAIKIKKFYYSRCHTVGYVLTQR